MDDGPHNDDGGQGLDHDFSSSSFGRAVDQWAALQRHRRSTSRGARVGSRSAPPTITPPSTSKRAQKWRGRSEQRLLRSGQSSLARR